MSGNVCFFPRKKQKTKTKVFCPCLKRFGFLFFLENQSFPYIDQKTLLFCFFRKNQKTKHLQTWTKNFVFFLVFYLGKAKKTNISRHGPKTLFFWVFSRKNQKTKHFQTWTKKLCFFGFLFFSRKNQKTKHFQTWTKKLCSFFGFLLPYLYIPYIQECLPLFFGGAVLHAYKQFSLLISKPAWLWTNLCIAWASLTKTIYENEVLL